MKQTLHCNPFGNILLSQDLEMKREDIGKAAKIYQEKDMISGQVKA